MARILITRPRARAQAFANDLQNLFKACEIIISPIFETVFLKADIPAFDTAIFTSQYGVEAFLRLGKKIYGADALCVGSQTQKNAQKAGFNARVSGYNVDDILANIIAEQYQKTYVHFCSTTRAGALSERAKCAGKTVLFREIYAQETRDLDPLARMMLGDADPLILPVFSARAGAHLYSLLQGEKICNITVIAMSKPILARLGGLRFERCFILEKPTREEMIRKIAFCLN